MGQIIRVVDKIKIGGTDFEVKLNHSVRGRKFRDVHIQNKTFRLEMPENEFMKMAACVLLAKKQFDILKGKENE